MKFRVFWDVAPCSHVEDDRGFRGAYCLRHEGIIALMVAVRTSETSVCFKETTRRYIPEGCYFYTRRRLNLKSHKFIVFFVITGGPQTTVGETLAYAGDSRSSKFAKYCSNLYVLLYPL
jgi:hypothetical protein